MLLLGPAHRMTEGTGVPHESRGTLVDLADRVVRIERDIDHIRASLDPLPLMLQASLERLAVVNERIAAHLEESKRAWNRLESHDRVITELQERIKSVDGFADVLKKLLWSLAAGAAAVLWWVIQKWVDHQNLNG